MPSIVVSGPTIPAGQSVSAGVDVSGGVIVGIAVPMNWRQGNLSFGLSFDNTVFFPLHAARGGQELTIGAARPGCFYQIEETAFRGLMWFRVRSGMYEEEVVQPEECVFTTLLWDGKYTATP